MQVLWAWFSYVLILAEPDPRQIPAYDFFWPALALLGGLSAGFLLHRERLLAGRRSCDHIHTWQRLGLVNDYTHHASEPLEYTKPPSGIVMLRGLSGGGGVAGQSFAILPPGFRPSYELVTAQGLTTTPSGAIFGLGTAAYRYDLDINASRPITYQYIAGR